MDHRYEEALEKARKGMPIDEVFPELKESDMSAQVTAKARPTKVTVSGTFQGYELEDQEDPTSICGKVFYVKDDKQYLAHVYIDSIEVCESEDERIRKDLITFICQFAPEHLKVQYVAYLKRQKEQKPTEWSEEEMAGCTKLTIAAIEDYYDAKIPIRDKLIHWLKSLHPQPKQPKVDLVAELKHHLATTPKEQLEKEWKELEPWGNVGPTVQEFLYGKQPEVDLEKEYKEWWETRVSGNVNIEHTMEWFMHETARHFYELGLNARKEE